MKIFKTINLIEAFSEVVKHLNIWRYSGDELKVGKEEKGERKGKKKTDRVHFEGNFFEKFSFRLTK